MEGTLHAFGFILIFVLTLFALVRYFRRPANAMQVFVAVLIGLLLISLHVIAGKQLVYATVLFVELPPVQSLMPGIAIALLGIFTTRPHRTVRVTAWIIFAVSLLLAGHFVWQVGTQRYTESPSSFTQRLQDQHQHELDNLNEALSHIQGYYPQKTFSASWLDRSVVFTRLMDEIMSWPCPPPTIIHHDATFTTYWHTWFTGLYGVHEVPIAVWYPGGKINDAIGKLEYRPRPY